jgi:aconitate hydratase
MQSLKPGQDVPVHITYADGKKEVINARSRIDTGNELTYFENGGILHYVIRKML